MYKSHLQTKFLTVLYARGSKPLANWFKCEKNGKVQVCVDEDINQSAIDLIGANLSTCYIKSPSPNSEFKSLGVRMREVLFTVKNLNLVFFIEVTILDDQLMKRHFKFSNGTNVTRLSHSICNLPLRLDEGWNLLRMDLLELTHKAFKTRYIECTDIKVNANCKLNRIFFSNDGYEELPEDYLIIINKDRRKFVSSKKTYVPPKPKIVVSPQKRDKLISATTVKKTNNQDKSKPDGKNSQFTGDIDIDVKQNTENKVSTSQIANNLEVNLLTSKEPASNESNVSLENIISQPHVSIQEASSISNHKSVLLDSKEHLNLQN